MATPATVQGSNWTFIVHQVGCEKCLSKGSGTVGLPNSRYSAKFCVPVLLLVGQMRTFAIEIQNSLFGDGLVLHSFQTCFFAIIFLTSIIWWFGVNSSLSSVFT